MNNSYMMEKETIYSTSLGLGKETELYGKWAKKNGLFLQLNKDSWHEGTQYWIPVHIRENRNLQKQLIDKLVFSNVYKKFELVDIKTILLPVAEVGNLIICLSKKYVKNNNVVNIFNSNEVKSYNIWSNFDWQSVDEKKLQQYSSIIQPVELSFMDLQEELHYRGGDSLNLINQSINVFFLPITILNFKIERQYQWVSIADDNSSLSFTPIKIEKDNIFTTKEESKKSSLGCLNSLCFFVIGVWLIIFIWPKLHGMTLLICLIGVVVVLYYLKKLVKYGIVYLIDSLREKKIQRIIAQRIDFLSKKGLTE